MKLLKNNIVLFIVSFIISFSVAEFSIRLILPPPQIQTINRRIENNSARRKAGTANDVVAVELSTHPEEGGLYIETKAGRRLSPNIEATIENHLISKRRIVISTNSLGYRNREILKKTGTRFLFLGDSITFGDYLPDNETFVRQIETMASRDQRNWETINAGVGAISMENELSILKETGISTEPDVVVINLYLNDFRESMTVTNPLPRFMKKSYLLYYAAVYYMKLKFYFSQDSLMQAQARNQKHWESEFTKNNLCEEGDFRSGPDAFNTLIVKHFRDWGGGWSPLIWDSMVPLFQEFKRLSQQHAFTLVVVIHPVRYQVEAPFVYDAPQQYIKKITASLEIPTLDLLPALHEEFHAKGTDLFYDSCHHTLAGSTLVADRIYAFLHKHS